MVESYKSYGTYHRNHVQPVFNLLYQRRTQLRPFKTNADRIYRIVTYVTEKDKNTNFTITEAPLAFQMKKDYPEVQEAARMVNREKLFLK